MMRGGSLRSGPPRFVCLVGCKVRHLRSRIHRNCDYRKPRSACVRLSIVGQLCRPASLRLPTAQVTLSLALRFRPLAKWVICSSAIAVSGIFMGVSKLSSLTMRAASQLKYAYPHASAAQLAVVETLMRSGLGEVESMHKPCSSSSPKPHPQELRLPQAALRLRAVKHCGAATAALCRLSPDGASNPVFVTPSSPSRERGGGFVAVLSLFRVFYGCF